MLIPCMLLIGLLFVPVLPSRAQQTGTICPPVPGVHETCVCRSEKGIIDLTSLSSKDGARFTGLKDSKGNTYFYNPCHAYNAGGQGCDVVYICQEAGWFSFDIASDLTEEMWIDTDGTPYLYYTGPGRSAKVFLHCNESASSPIATTTGDANVTDHYVFHITAKEVCPGWGRQTGRPCPPAPGRSETCVCKTDKGIIDLTSLSGSDGGARFADLKDPRGYSYYYNPCQPFNARSQGCDDDDVFICQKAGSLSFAIGLAEEMWIDTDGTPYLYYTGVGDRVTKVFLHCNESYSSPIATTNGDLNVTDHYVFHITAMEVCPGKGGRGSGGFTIGVAIAIAFAILILSAVFITGCVIFAVVLYKHKNKRAGYERVN